MSAIEPRRALIAGIAGAVLLLPILAEAQRRCPEGMVWGGRKCEWQNVCPDGRPTLDGLCSDGLPPRPPVPAPRPTTPPFRPAPPQPQPPAPRVVITPVDPPVAATRRCDRATVFHPRQDAKPKVKSGIFGGEVQARRVLFIGGNAGVLFRRYLTDAKDAGRAPDLKRLEIVHFDSGGQRKELVGGDQVRMSVGQMLAGMTWEQVWTAQLGSIESANRSDAEQQAAALEADLVCSGAGR